jgi:hypothetical protein
MVVYKLQCVIFSNQHVCMRAGFCRSSRHKTSPVLDRGQRDKRVPPAAGWDENCALESGLRARPKGPTLIPPQGVCFSKPFQTPPP